MRRGGARTQRAQCLTPDSSRRTDAVAVRCAAVPCAKRARSSLRTKISLTLRKAADASRTRVLHRLTQRRSSSRRT